MTIEPEISCTNWPKRLGSGALNPNSFSQWRRDENNQKLDNCADNKPLHKDSTLAASLKEKDNERLLDKEPTSRGFPVLTGVTAASKGSEHQPRSRQRDGTADEGNLPVSASAWKSGDAQPAASQRDETGWVHPQRQKVCPPKRTDPRSHTPCAVQGETPGPPQDTTDTTLEDVAMSLRNRTLLRYRGHRIILHALMHSVGKGHHTKRRLMRRNA